MCASITQFVTEFSYYYRRFVDPLRSHKNLAKTRLHEKLRKNLDYIVYLMKFNQDKHFAFVVKTKYLLRKIKMRM